MWPTRIRIPPLRQMHMKQLPPSERLAVLVSNVTQTMLGISFAPSLGDQAHPDLCWRTAIMLVDGARPVVKPASVSDPDRGDVLVPDLRG